MLKFYAIEQGHHDSWEIHYVLATSAQDAADRYIKRLKAKYTAWNVLRDSTVGARVYETEFDEFGVLQRLFDLEDGRPVLDIQVPD